MSSMKQMITTLRTSVGDTRAEVVVKISLVSRRRWGKERTRILTYQKKCLFENLLAQNRGAKSKQMARNRSFQNWTFQTNRSQEKATRLPLVKEWHGTQLGDIVGDRNGDFRRFLALPKYSLDFPTLVRCVEYIVPGWSLLLPRFSPLPEPSIKRRCHTAAERGERSGLWKCEEDASFAPSSVRLSLPRFLLLLKKNNAEYSTTARRTPCSKWMAVDFRGFLTLHLVALHIAGRQVTRFVKVWFRHSEKRKPFSFRLIVPK